MADAHNQQNKHTHLWKSTFDLRTGIQLWTQTHTKTNKITEIQRQMIKHSSAIAIEHNNCSQNEVKRERKRRWSKLSNRRENGPIRADESGDWESGDVPREREVGSGQEWSP